MTTRAKKVVELSKGEKKILVALWENNQISTCITQETKQYCETCQANDELCQQWLEHLQEKGYTATEIELEEVEPDESLPRFMEERVIRPLEE